jgi:hypothetical protein
MKTTILICSLSLAGLMMGEPAGFAQTKVYSCSYDSTGNRKNRRFVQLKSGTQADGSNQTNPDKPIEETIEDHVIKIYPNPTQGSLTLFIGGMKSNETLVFHLYNLMGVCLLEGKSVRESTTLELGKHPAGAYVLRLRIGQDQKELTIIKE